MVTKTTRFLEGAAPVVFLLVPGAFILGLLLYAGWDDLWPRTPGQAMFDVLFAGLYWRWTARYLRRARAERRAV